MNDSSADILEALKRKLGRLKAEIEPLKKQTQSVSDHRNRLEVEILEAQIQALKTSSPKLDRRAEKIKQLEAEIERITSETPSDPRSQKEMEKLEAEIVSLKASTDKARSEIKGTWGRFIEFCQVAAGAIPFLAVLVALLTLWHNQETQRVQNTREQHKQIAEFARDLGDKSPTIRSARASALATYLKDEKTVETVATILISAILQEEDELVLGALRATLKDAGAIAAAKARESLSDLRTALERIKNEYTQTQNEIRGLAAEHERQKELTKRQSEIAARRQARQHATVTLALIARDQAPPGSCVPKPCGQCRTNLTNFYLDGFDFAHVQANLCAADFSQSSLVGAKLASINLSHAQFDNADLRQASLRGSTLQNASFTRSEMGWQSAGPNMSHPRADFTQADLRSATFSEACLSWADLAHTAYPIQSEQIRTAYAEGARLAPQLEAELLKAAQPLGRNARCALKL